MSLLPSIRPSVRCLSVRLYSVGATILYTVYILYKYRGSKIDYSQKFQGTDSRTRPQKSGRFTYMRINGQRLLHKSFNCQTD